MQEEHFTNNIYSFTDKEITSNSKVNFLDIKKTASIIRAINHKLRQSIVKLLEENKELTVTEIYVRLRIEQSVASQHLAILRRANYLKTKRVGKKIFYSLNEEYLDHVNKFIANLLEVQN